ncbi:hypothetical protein GOHSU_23_00270 [Gordonia hirsuta DSM 44140 = NBRC 16056]|uniref:DUF937 domain-containing protein n=2 Tax=Gordonia hirsuta TaxID=53427 RepID=L7LA97_9ACTN|nr:DUF937 domain-containing protein [Gordonia hirsuta]GAC57681.1 hypothetical protein GOHSU_23_00270 [Gordonia hirsuta DSM 44140 = NBRC 16056]
MTDLNDLLNRLPVDQLAAQLGVSPDEVRAASAQALPTLVAGLAAQTGDDASTARLVGALEQHDNDLSSGDIALDQVDVADGEKIVGKLFGDKTDDVALGVSGAVPAAGVDQGLVKKLLPMLAPIVLSYVMSQLGGKKGAPQSQSGGLGDLLGGMLGGGGGADNALGSILGSVLGGGKGGGGKGGGNNPLGSILGGLLGGK